MSDVKQCYVFYNVCCILIYNIKELICQEKKTKY